MKHLIFCVCLITSLPLLAMPGGPAPARRPADLPKRISGTNKKRNVPLTKYEQQCAARFFEFCEYLLTPPDIVIDSAAYSAGEKTDEIVMQRERAEDTARIKKAVLRYTVEPAATITSDSLHFSQDEMSDSAYRHLEKAFATMEKFLDTCYSNSSAKLRLVPLRLHDNPQIRAQINPAQLSRTFLLQRDGETLAVLVFTPRDRMTPTQPPRICGWSVDFHGGRMLFHDLAKS